MDSEGRTWSDVTLLVDCNADVDGLANVLYHSRAELDATSLQLAMRRDGE